MGKQTYFLGANSASGFYSAYNHFCPPEGNNFLWVIKGGPGCGKSSFMRKIGHAAEEKGLDVEYVLCSGDPDSIDGVYIPEKAVAYVDGTAPHITEVTYPGANGLYLDLGRFYNKDALQKKAEAIRSINRQYKECYQKAYAELSQFPAPAASQLPKGCPTRFHTAITCKGIVTIPQPNTQHITNAELHGLLQTAAKEDIISLHPLWPNLATGIFIQKENTFFATESEFPDCVTAISILREAKQYHDELENIYNPHVDFDGIYALAEMHIEKNL